MSCYTRWLVLLSLISAFLCVQVMRWRVGRWLGWKTRLAHHLLLPRQQYWSLSSAAARTCSAWNLTTNVHTALHYKADFKDNVSKNCLDIESIRHSILTRQRQLFLALKCIILLLLGCILTTALLMQALDSRKYFTEISEYLKQLCSVDPYREAYYRDLCESPLHSHFCSHNEILLLLFVCFLLLLLLFSQ